MYLWNYYVLIVLVVMFTFMGLVVSSLMNMWMVLEISSLLFLIKLMNFNKFVNLKGGVGVMIYYLIQVISSSLMLVSILSIEFIYLNEKFMMIMMILMFISLLMKLGIYPFHFWVPMIMKNLNWMLNYILMTFMKIIPLIMIMTMNLFIDLQFFLGVLSSLISVLLSMKQMNLKLIYSYSSINHTSWMIMGSMINKNLFYIYLLIYMFILFILVLFMSLYELENLIDFNYLYKYNFKEYFIYYMCMIMGMGGLPLFLGFIMKWMVIQVLVGEWMYMMIILMILMSIVMLSVYIHMGFYLMYVNSSNIKNFMIVNYQMKMNLLILMVMLLFLFYLYMYM